MSEFKFACPVCGQHITADSSSSGSQLDCPTCFRTIIVPQAPSADSRLILSASQPSKGRPRFSRGSDLAPLRRTRPGLSIAGALLLVLLVGGAAAFYHYLPRIRELIQRRTASQHEPASSGEPVATPHERSPAVSAGAGWTLDLARAAIPEQRASGTIHGQKFSCEQASLTGGALLLRQGAGWPPELAVAIVYPVKSLEELRGRTFEFSPDRSSPRPQVVLRWKDRQQQAQKQEMTNGYALRLVFAQEAGGRMPGKIFLALPDESRSLVAGTFEAEIRPPNTKK